MDNKVFLITGGCGFIGSNFINYLSKKKVKIICLDNMYYSASEDNIDLKVRQSNNFYLYKGNINDKYMLLDIFQKHHITDIVHFAAQSHVDSSFEDSLQYTEDNVKGTHTLLEIVRKHSPHINFYHFSTDEVYGETKDDIQMEEMSVLCPTNPYAATKAAAEMLVNSYKYSYNLNTIIIRCNNVYGPNQYKEKLIPKFIHLLQNNQKLPIHGDGSYLRSFIHVYDVSTALEIIILKGNKGEIYNIGSEIEYSVNDISILLLNIMKPAENHKNWVEYVNDRPFNDKRYFININKIKKLGWKKTIDLETGIRSLIA